MEEINKHQYKFVNGLDEKNKNENKIRQIMENNLLTLRKKNHNKKMISKIKDNITLYSPVEKKYILTSTSFEITNNLNDYYNNLENKNIFLYQSINNASQIISNFSNNKCICIKNKTAPTISRATSNIKDLYSIKS